MEEKSHFDDTVTNFHPRIMNNASALERYLLYNGIGSISISSDFSDGTHGTWLTPASRSSVLYYMTLTL